ncbi:MAG: hypothetical protein IJ849_10180 [Selenomonadaceae bacterium]|nr:hypothetical protein [Selenomonadaceae bacterium]
MRVASMQSTMRYQTQLNDSWDLTTKYLEQADGNSLHRPSDNSVNYSKYLRYQNSYTENIQYQSNVKTATSWMKSADDVMIDMTDLLKTIVEKTVNAANETNNDDNEKDMATDIFAKIQQVVSLGNSQSGDRYLFAGQSDMTSPYIISTEKYNRGLVRSLNDMQAAYFVNDADATGNAPQMLGLKGTSADGTKTMNFFLSTKTGYIYDEGFALEGYKSEIAAGRTVEDGSNKKGEWTAAATTGFVSTYFESNGVMKGSNYTTTYTEQTVTTYTYNAGTGEYEIDTSTTNPVTSTVNNTVTGTNDSTYSFTTGPATTNGDYTVTTYSTPSEITQNTLPITATVDGVTYNLQFDFTYQYIATYNGDAKHISMVKKNGSTEVTADTVNVTGQDLFGSDIFDNENSGNMSNVYYNGERKSVSSGVAAINDLLMVVAKMEAADYDWLSSDGITASDSAHAKAVQAQTGIAARHNIYESVSTMLVSQNEVITQDITDVSGTDVAALAVKMMEAQTLYNMMLSVGARILPQSLADYL